jgi:hypothetical protein
LEELKVRETKKMKIKLATTYNKSEQQQQQQDARNNPEL